MQPLSFLQLTVARNLVRYAAGHNITCPCCGDLMDQSRTVLLTDTADHCVTMCAECYGKPIGSFTAGSVTVYDGRDLFKLKGKAAHQWRFA
jgi:hypothetical protein